MNMKSRMMFGTLALALLLPSIGMAQDLVRAATPAIRPASGTYTGSVQVTLSCATPDAGIRYTLNGLEPTATNSYIYSEPFTLKQPTTVKAKAFKSGFQNSLVNVAVYQVVPLPRVARPVLHPAPGTYTGTVTVSMSCETLDASIRYTLNGLEPNETNSLPYTEPLTLTRTATLKARAFKAGFLDGYSAGGLYTIVLPQVARPVLAPAGGTFTGSVTVALSCETPGAAILYAIGANSASATNFQPYTEPLKLEHSGYVMAKAVKDGFLNSLLAYGSFTIVIPRVATPVITPASGTYTNSVTVTLSCATPESVIRYTLNGLEPNATNSLLYSEPFTLRAAAGVRAKAFKAGMLDSSTASASFSVVIPRVATPVIAPASGTYTNSVTVTLSCATPEAVIRYTLNGLEPNATNSLLYSEPFTLRAAAGVKARAFKDGMLDSATASASFSVVIPQVAKPVLSPAGGTFTGSVTVVISCETPGAAILYAIGANSASATNFQPYTEPIRLTQSGYVMAKAVKEGFLNSLQAYGFYTIVIPRVATPVITPASGTYTGSVVVTLSCATPEAVIRYTLNGLEPNATNSLLYSEPFTLRAAAGVKARAFKAGMLDSATASASFSVVIPRVAKPALSPAGGTFTGSVTVALSCETPGAAILYAIGANSASATNFQPYTEPIRLTQSGYVMAKAVKDGFLNSLLAYGSFTIVVPRAATPVIAPASGTYTGSVVVTLSCATPEAVIRYTLNGLEPNATNSLLYSEPFTLRAAAGVKARAFKAGMLDSLYASASYSVVMARVAKPVLSPAGGTYTGSVTIAISCETPGAGILFAIGANTGYATNFSPYTEPGTLVQSGVVVAKAVKAGMLDSVLSGASYTIVPARVAAPVFEPAGGAYVEGMSVIIFSETPDAVIYYTLDGTEPTRTSSRYEDPIILNAPAVIHARAVIAGMTDSAVSGAVFEN